MDAHAPFELQLKDPRDDRTLCIHTSDRGDHRTDFASMRSFGGGLDRRDGRSGPVL